MDNIERFTALIAYVEQNPETMARYGADGVAVLNRIAAACAAQDAAALDAGIEDFLALVASGKPTRGITPGKTVTSVEQFNRIEKVTKAVLEKMPRG
jgi:hypothetical protein